MAVYIPKGLQCAATWRNRNLLSIPPILAVSIFLYFRRNTLLLSTTLVCFCGTFRITSVQPHQYTAQYFVPLKGDNATDRASQPHRTKSLIIKDSKAPLPEMAELQPMRWAVPNPYNRLTFEPMQIAIPQCGGKGCDFK